MLLHRIGLYELRRVPVPKGWTLVPIQLLRTVPGENAANRWDLPLAASCLQPTAQTRAPFPWLVSRPCPHCYSSIFCPFLVVALFPLAPHPGVFLPSVAPGQGGTASKSCSVTPSARRSSAACSFAFRAEYTTRLPCPARTTRRSTCCGTVRIRRSTALCCTGPPRARIGKTSLTT